MIISKMNRYFARHGKITFGLIAIVISVSFVLYLSRVSVFDLFRSRGPQSLSLLGRKISVDDRIAEARRIALFFSVHDPSINLKRIPISPDSKMVTLSLLQYYAAKDMGIAVSDKEIANFISEGPLFQSGGKFDLQKYNEFVETRLKPAGLSKTDLDDAIRRNLAMRKLREEITFNVITTRDELRSVFNSRQMKVKAKIIYFDKQDCAKKIKVTEQDLKNYFDSHQDTYKYPPASKIETVFFPYSCFNAKAASLVTLEKMKKHYDANKYLYMDMAKSKNATTGAVYKPFAEVADNIRKELLRHETTRLASDAATKFSDSAYSAIEDLFYNTHDKTKTQTKALEIFKKKLAESGLKSTTIWIPKNDSKRPALAKALVLLTTDNPVSDPVKEANGVTVAYLLEKKPAKQKTFEEAKAEVKADYIATHATLLARENARNAALKISQALEKKNAFDKTVKELGLKAESLPELSMMTPLFMPNGGLVSQKAFKTPKGSASEPVNTPDGAFIVYVESRTFPSDKDFEKAEPMFRQIYANRKKSSVYQAFLNSLMNASFVADKEK